jgi:DNA-binding beta-propeller fold protein YncE
VAANSKGELAVSEYGPVERVQWFTPDGSRCLGALGAPGSQPGLFSRVEGLCFDAGDRLYVADSCNHRIQVFSPGRALLRTYGKPGSGPGGMSYPYDIKVDSMGRQFVCEFGNSRIQVFDAQDRPLETIGSPGTEPGQLNNPWAVALDSMGNLYVADGGNNRVQKLIRRQPLAPSAAARQTASAGSVEPH